MKLSLNFHDYEFVPPEIYQLYGKNSRWFIDERIIHLAQFTRDWFDAGITINNWKWGGNLKNRGYRVPSTTVGSKYSQHKLAKAIDINVSGLTADETRKAILQHQGEFMMHGLTTIEHPGYSPNWVHMDIRYTGLKHILIVKPAALGTLSFANDNEYYKYVDNRYERIN